MSAPTKNPKLHSLKCTCDGCVLRLLGEAKTKIDELSAQVRRLRKEKP